MNGLRWHADLVHGQKTGVYLDQRENYLAAAQVRARQCASIASHPPAASRCISPRPASKSKRSIVPSMRSARPKQTAISTAFGNVTFREADVFDVLTGYAGARSGSSTRSCWIRRRSRSPDSRSKAPRADTRRSTSARLRLLDSGGVLVTCSCSHHFSEAMLLEVLAEASLDTGKTLRVLERRAQAQDHPILLTVPETHYLKCLIVQVV